MWGFSLFSLHCTYECKQVSTYNWGEGEVHSSFSPVHINSRQKREETIQEDTSRLRVEWETDWIYYQVRLNRVFAFKTSLKRRICKRVRKKQETLPGECELVFNTTTQTTIRTWDYPTKHLVTSLTSCVGRKNVRFCKIQNKNSEQRCAYGCEIFKVINILVSWGRCIGTSAGQVGLVIRF